MCVWPLHFCPSPTLSVFAAAVTNAWCCQFETGYPFCWHSTLFASYALIPYPLSWRLVLLAYNVISGLAAFLKFSWLPGDTVRRLCQIHEAHVTWFQLNVTKCSANTEDQDLQDHSACPL